MIGDWDALLNIAMPEEELSRIRHHSRTGRLSGDEAFLDRLEGTVGRRLKPKKRGQESKQTMNSNPSSVLP